jgi:tetratricopeptide (TPR) repeat protein
LTSPQNDKERVRERRNALAEENLDKGLELYMAGKLDEALIYFRKAVEVRGDAVDRHWLGSTLTSLRRYEEALPNLKRAVELHGDAVDYHWLGSTLCHMSLYEQALPYLREADQLMDDKPASKEVRQANNRWLGETLFGLKRYREAEPYLEKAVMLADEEDPSWFLKCLDIFRSCLEKTGERPLSENERKKCDQAWEKTWQSNTVKQYIGFLKAYPCSEYTDVAKSQIHTLRNPKTIKR